MQVLIAAAVILEIKGVPPVRGFLRKPLSIGREAITSVCGKETSVSLS